MLHYVMLHYIMLHIVTLCYMAFLFFIALLCYVALLCCIALHCTTLYYVVMVHGFKQSIRFMRLGNYGRDNLIARLSCPSHKQCKPSWVTKQHCYHGNSSSMWPVMQSMKRLSFKQTAVSLSYVVDEIK